MNGVAFTDDDIDMAMQQVGACEALAAMRAPEFTRLVTDGEDFGFCLIAYFHGHNCLLGPEAAHAVDALFNRRQSDLAAFVEGVAGQAHGIVHVRLRGEHLLSLRASLRDSGHTVVDVSPAPQL